MSSFGVGFGVGVGSGIGTGVGAGEGSAGGFTGGAAWLGAAGGVLFSSSVALKVAVLLQPIVVATNRHTIIS